MTRGFVTISTGNEYYYKLATNLLMSYRYNSKNPLPFAILSDKKNKYTDLFDNVVIIEKPAHSFMDKFSLLKICPYDENIFIDADSLAFGDLNVLWNLFKDATDFSAIGYNSGLYEQGGGLQYNVEGIGKYGKLIKYKTWVHAGVMFIRNAPSLEKFYNDCMEILKDYDKLEILSSRGSYDEVTFAIAMPMNNYLTVPEKTEIFAFRPYIKSIIADIVKGKLSYKHPIKNMSVDNGVLLHFTTAETRKPFYIHQVEKLKRKLKGDSVNFIDRYKASQFNKYYLNTRYFFQSNLNCILSLPKRAIGRLRRLVSNS